MYLLILSIREETLGIATRIVRERIVQFCIPYHISAPSKQRYIVLLGLLCFLLLLLIIIIIEEVIVTLHETNVAVTL